MSSVSADLTHLTNHLFNGTATLRAKPVNRDLKTCGFKSLWQSDAVGSLAGQINIEHFGANVAIKVAMLAHVRAKTGRAAVHVHLPRHAGLHEGVEAVVDGGHGNIGHFALGADEHFLGGRMIALLHQHIVDVLALRGEPKAARGELTAQMFIQFFVFDSGHSSRNLWLLPGLVKIWNNSN